MNSVLAFVVVLGVLVFFHELGHFLAARLCGVGVEIFSLGFGPRIAGWKSGRTDYRISAIPLGGFVKMVGDEPDAEIAPEDIPCSFTHKHVLQRIVIAAAGPGFNFLLAFLIFFGIFRFSGTHVLKAQVGTVGENTPAYAAGLQTGDLIAAINGRKISQWDEMSEMIGESRGKTLHLTIIREKSELQMDVVPSMTETKTIFGENTKRYIIGITSSGEVLSRKLTPVKAIAESLSRTWEITGLTIMSIVKLIQGVVSTDTLGGPIMIAQMAGEQAKAGAASLVFFIALLSINLAVLNLLPIPVLDGGHLLFFFIELVIKRPVSTRIREFAQQAGMFVLLLLMVFVFYNDIARIFSAS